MTKLSIHQAREVRIGPYVLNVIDAQLGDSFNFGCLRCGECCKLPPAVNPKEVSELSKHLGISNSEFLQKHTQIQENTPESLRHVGLSNADILTKYPEFHESPKYGWKVMLAKKDNHCVFLKKGEAATCSVYKAVPRQCRGRPLIGHVNPFLKIVDLETMNFTINPCQGFGTGPEYTVEEWIQLKGLKQGWQDELDYLHNIYSIKCKSLYHLKSAIIGLYTK